jgi:5-methylcytosine-specific restriction enzyme subunit McrC
MSTREPIVLSEYEATTVELDHGGARTLSAVGGGKLTVTVGPGPGKWQISSGGIVGTIVTPDVRLLIRPKIPLANLFLLLDVEIPEEGWLEGRFGFGVHPDLLPAVAAFFAREAAAALARGARRDYRVEEDWLVALRGRVHVAGQFRTPGIASPIACRFDEYSADIPENRVLRAAARRLLRLPGVRPETRTKLERLLHALLDVADHHVPADAADRIPITRLNRHYEPALRLASVVLRNTGLLDRVGAVEASAFLLDMPALFQRWVTERLRRHLRGRLDVAGEPTLHLGLGRRVPMAPDLLFSEGNRNVYVADVKYKLSSGLALSSDYYQLLAYTTALGMREGALLYCQLGEEDPGRQIVVRNSGAELWTYRIAMTGSTTEVENAVAALADWLHSRTLHGVAVVQ